MGGEQIVVRLNGERRGSRDSFRDLDGGTTTTFLLVAEDRNSYGNVAAPKASDDVFTGSM